MSTDGSEAWPAPSFGSEEAPAAGDGDSQGSNENATSSASGAGTFLQPHVPKLSLTATSSAVSATASSLPEKPPDVDGRPATTADGVAVFEEDTRSSWNLEPPSSGAATPSGATAPKDAEDEEAALEEREPSSSCAGGGGGDVPCAKSATASDSSGGGENRERTPVVSFAPTVVDCDSQNSGSSVKSGAGGRKRFSDDEVTSEASTTITADKLFEYHWPQDCGDAYMLQEQVRAAVGFGAASG